MTSEIKLQTHSQTSVKSSWLWLQIAVALILWASAFPAIRVALREYSPTHLALGRYLVASATLLVIALFQRVPFPAKSDWVRIGAAGFFGFTLYNVGLNSGEVHVPAGTASFLVNTAPVWALLILTIGGHERVARRGWLGVGISLLGVAVIALSHHDSGAQDLHAQTLHTQVLSSGLNPDPLFLRGALCILLAAFGTSFYVLLQKNLLSRYAALPLTTWMIWAGTLWMLPLGFWPLGGGLLSEVRHASFGATFSMIYMGVFPGALAYALWARVLSQMAVSRAVSFIYLVPILATAISWLWLGEELSVLAFVGGLITLGGVVLVNTARKVK